MTLHQMIMVVVETVVCGGAGGAVVGITMGMLGIWPDERKMREEYDRRSKV